MWAGLNGILGMCIFTPLNWLFLNDLYTKDRSYNHVCLIDYSVKHALGELFLKTSNVLYKQGACRNPRFLIGLG